MHHPLLTSPLCELIFSGRYTELLKRTIDSRSGSHSAEDTPFVVGALAFSGRQDEAIAALRWWTKSHGNDATIRVASHFFLALGECRSGRYAAAIEHVRTIVRATERSDALHAFFVHQAIGLLRHFIGHAHGAARHAAAARQAALEARFAYGRMLALDLLGHAIVLEGRIYAGIALLEQSAELAESLGLVANAGSPRAIVSAYRAQFGIDGVDDSRSLKELVTEVKPEDAYSRRMLLSELAIQRAFAGRGVEARESIEEAAQIALPDGDRRAKIRLFISDAIVTAFSRGSASAREKLALARSFLDPVLDDGLDVELSWAEALVRGTLHSEDSATQARMAKLARRTRNGRARIMAESTGSRNHELDTDSEDRIADLLRCIEHDHEAARHRIISHARWGWLPKLFGLDPGRRIFLLHTESLLVVEDRGDVAPLEMPGAVLVRLLEAIATRPMQKDELVHHVWGMKVYRAARHDSLVHTTISRLRTALGPAGTWIRPTDAGYTIADGVVLVHQRGDSEIDEEAMVFSAAGRTTTAMNSRQKTSDERRAHILSLVAREPLSTSDIAAKLSVSEMTAFRILSTMAKEGLLERTGHGKRTRYRVRS